MSMQGRYSRLSEQSRACKSMVLKILGRAVIQFQLSPTFMMAPISLQKKDYALQIDEYGKCVLAREIIFDSKTSKQSQKTANKVGVHFRV